MTLRANQLAGLAAAIAEVRPLTAPADVMLHRFFRARHAIGKMDRALIAEGHDLVRACLRRDQPGPFQIQAAIAAVHADAATAADTDWSQVVALYDQLFALRPNAVIALNRAVAIAERDGAPDDLRALAAIDSSALVWEMPTTTVLSAGVIARAASAISIRSRVERDGASPVLPRSV